MKNEGEITKLPRILTARSQDLQVLFTDTSYVYLLENVPKQFRSDIDDIE